jgi:5-methylcytosine-specific restriction endonuclease McrA
MRPKKTNGGQLGNQNRRLPEGDSAKRALFNQYRGRSRRTGKRWALTLEEFLGITQQICDYCGREPSQVFLPNKYTHGAYVYNGIDRVDNDKGYEPNNSVACCFTCNVAKASMTRDQFIAWVRRVYAKIMA